MALREHLQRILRSAWRLLTMLRVGLANLLFLLLLLVLLTLVFAERKVAIPDGAALVLDSLGDVVEQKTPGDSLLRLTGTGQNDHETALHDVVDAIDFASSDARISMIVLHPDTLQSAGLSKVQEIGSALTRFRAAGKQVVAVADWLDQGQFLLASFADEIWLNPMGDVFLEGFSVYREYYRDALDKLLVDVHVFRAGEAKDAAEPMQLASMSEASREANRVWLDDAWQSYTATATGQRQLPPEAIDNYINGIARIFEQVQGDGALAARQYGLVDELRTREEAREALKLRLGEDMPAVDFRRYLGERRSSMHRNSAEQIALVVAQGMILPGEQPRGFIGGDTVAGLLKNARENDSVRAVVLRIDSPGGVMFAGEVIRNAVLELKASGKPVVVSMGSVAASGGYQIAAAADEIWAQETTLTGSIGVLLQFPTFSRSLEKLGVHSDGVATTDIAGGLQLDRPLAPDLERRFELSVAHAYRQFLQLVADGRAMTVDQVARAAEGRVWTGRQALDLGLIDQLGELNDAIASAAALAGLEDYQLIRLEEPLSFRERLLSMLPSDLAITRLLPADWVDMMMTLRSALPFRPEPAQLYSLCEDCRLLP